MPINISAGDLIKRFQHTKSRRSNWETLWQICADYCLPQKATITKTRSPGAKLKTDIYDSTAIHAAQVLAAGLHSYLTNPTSRWFALDIFDKSLKDSFSVKSWLKEVEDITFDSLNSSNFNQQIHEGYIDFGIFGNMVIYEEEDPETDIAFHTRPPSEVLMLANAHGKIDTVFRSFTYTARQAYQLWGNNAGERTLELLKAGKVEEDINFLHITLPREERNVSKRDSRNMPFSSLYIEPKSKKVLSEGGYEEFPFFIPRFYKVSDSEYAYSPASVAIADIKMLNSMSKTIIKGAQKDIDPSIILPHDGYLLPFKTSAGGINYKMSTNPDDRVEILNIQRKFNIGLDLENQRRESINRMFFVDLFLMLAQQPNMTATEVIQRVNEKMLILGPVLGRLMHELLDPIIIRTINILMRNRKLPEPPAELRGKNYKIEYISPLAKAQRASEANSITDLLLAVRSMWEMEPQVIDNFNFDKAAKEMADINNISPDLLRSDEEVGEIREMRRQAEQARAALEEIPLAAEGAKGMAEAETALKGGVDAGRTTKKAG